MDLMQRFPPPSRTPGWSRHSSAFLALLLTLGLACAPLAGWSADAPSWNAENALPSMMASAQVGEYVTELRVDRGGRLWMGTLTEGLCRHDPDGFRCFGAEDGYTSGALRAVAEAADGTLWFGGQSGLTRWDEGGFSRVDVADDLPAAQIWSLLLDRHGRLWVGTEAGLYRRDQGHFQRVELPDAPVPGENPRFNRRLAFALVEDRQGQVWIGMDGVGALKFDGQRYTRYTRADGLASNDITAIVVADDGALWFTSRTGGGLTRYDGHAFKRYGEADGVPAVDSWAAFRDHRGQLWFGMAGAGVLRYDGSGFQQYRDQTGLTRNHVQSIAEDAHGVLWFGFSGGLFRLDPAPLGGAPQLVNVSREGPWDAP